MNSVDTYFDKIKDIKGVQKVYDLRKELDDQGLLNYDMRYFLTNNQETISYRYNVSSIDGNLFKVTKLKKTNENSDYQVDKLAIGILPWQYTNIIDIISLLSTANHRPTIYSSNYEFDNTHHTLNDSLYVKIVAGSREINIETSKFNIVVKKEVTLIDKTIVVADVIPQGTADTENGYSMERYIIPVNGNMIIKLDYSAELIGSYDISYIFLDPDAIIRSITICSDGVSYGHISENDIKDIDIGNDPDDTAYNLIGSPQLYKINERIMVYKLSASLDDFFNCNFATVNDKDRLEYYAISYILEEYDKKLCRDLVFKITDNLNIEELVNTMQES